MDLQRLSRNSAIALLLTASVANCLPQDTRPVPGTALILAVPDDDLSAGISTVDGWQITFDKFLVHLGYSSIEGDNCIGYADPDYGRVLDMTAAGPQRVGVLYGIGHCDFDFELRSPHDDSLLGAGVTAEDRALMRTPGDDPYAKDAGMSIHIVGVATRGDEEKRFTWSYRYRYDYGPCKSLTPDGWYEGVDFVEAQEFPIEITIHGGTLFQDKLELGGPLRFDAFASADTSYGDDDGYVTLEELQQVPLTDIATEEAYADGTWESLLDYMYLGLFKRVVRYERDGKCEEEQFVNDRAPR